MTDKEIRNLLKDNQLKSYEICSKLNICDREWRKIVHDYNEQYDKRERLIVSDSNGYELTTNKKLIKGYAIRLLHHGLSELKTAKNILKTLSNKNQLKLMEDEVDIVDLAMKLNINVK